MSDAMKRALDEVCRRWDDTTLPLFRAPGARQRTSSTAIITIHWLEQYLARGDFVQ